MDIVRKNNGSDDFWSSFIIFRFMDYIIEKPFHSIYLTSIIMGSLIRIYLSMSGGGIYHPDELFQSLEPAHYLVFGYGYLPSEFKNEVPGEEYYARARSWLFPMIFGFFMKIGEVFNWDYHSTTLPVIYFFIAVNSILLIFSVQYFVKIYTNNHTMSKLAAIYIAVWWRVIHLSTRIFTNTVLLPLLFFALARAVHNIRYKEEITLFDAIVMMIGLGTVTYIRLDLGIIVFFLALSELVKRSSNGVKLQLEKLKLYGEILFYGTLGWFIGMVVDFNIYDSTNLIELIQVPRNWFFFNFVEGKSDIFGVTPYGWYFQELIIHDGLFPLFVLCVIAITSGLVFRTKFSGFNNTDPVHDKLTKEFFHLVMFGLVVFFTWNLYETPWRNGWDIFGSMSHKEERFATSMLVAALVFAAIASVYFGNLLKFLATDIKLAQPEKYKISLGFIRSINLIVILISLLLVLQGSANYTERYPSEVFEDTNHALQYIGQNGENVTGVGVFLIWFYTGMYTHLHLNVSIHTVSDIQNHNLIRFVLLFSDANYLVLPKYQTFKNPSIYNVLDEGGWRIVTMFEYSVEIWHKPFSS